MTLQAGRTGVLSLTAFRRLWTASAAEGVANDVSRNVVPLVAVATLGAGAWQIGVLNALSLSAFLLFGVPIGVWVDRLQRRRVLVGADLARAAALATIPIAYLVGALTLPQLFVVSFVIGSADVFFSVGQSALLPRLVPHGQLQEATARLATLQSVAAIGSPGLAGLLLKVVAGPMVLFTSVAGFVASAVMIFRIEADDAAPTRASREPFVRSAMEGLRFAVRQPVVRALFLSSMTLNSANMFLNAVHVVYVLTVLHVPASVAAGLGVFQAVGALVGSLLVGPITRKIGIGATKIGCGVAMMPAVALLPLAGFGAGPAVAYVAAANFGWGFLLVLGGLAGAGIIGRLTPIGMLGRVTASSRLFGMGIMPIASLVGGALAAAHGLTLVLWFGAVLAGVSTLPVIASPLRRWRSFPDR